MIPLEMYLRNHKEATVTHQFDCEERALVIGFGEPPPCDFSKLGLSELMELATQRTKAFPRYEVYGNTVFPPQPYLREGLDFSQALAAMKAGYPVRRAAWTGINENIFFCIRGENEECVPSITHSVQSPAEEAGGTPIALVTLNEWVNDIEDLLADDWEFHIHVPPIVVPKET